MKHGFIKVAAAIPSVSVADVKYNLRQQESLIESAEKEDVDIIVFPELSMTGYSCQDLFQQNLLIKEAEQSVEELLTFTLSLNLVVIVGAPISTGSILLNCAIVIRKGKILGVVPKTFLPNYNEFYERRWFASSLDLNNCHISYAGQDIYLTNNLYLFQSGSDVTFGIELCEDLWGPIPPSSLLTQAGADLIFNLSASDELIGKHNYLKSLLSQQSARSLCGYIYSSSGFGESTQDVVYGGNALIYENGKLLNSSKRFQLEPQLISAQIDIDRLRAERLNNTTFTVSQKQYSSEVTTVQIGSFNSPEDWCLSRDINAFPFIPKANNMDNSCEEILNIQIMGLVKRLSHIHTRKVVLGISGGLDSTLALLICVKAIDKLGFNRSDVIGVTMPGFGTTDRTYNNAISLMKALGITIREISIVDAVNQHFKDIGHDSNIRDITYENSQARERTQLLMDISNQVGGIVIGTGDLSELALGWCTYNGDHMSMYGVNVGVPKTLIRYLVNYFADNIVDETTAVILKDVIDTPISPELTPADAHGKIKQKTEDIVGPYELHDFFLYYVLRFGYRPSKIFLLAKNAFEGKYTDETIKYWLSSFYKRFFSQQFKRSCLPDGPKVGSVSLSPRGDWRMPSDAIYKLWTDEVSNL